LALALGLTLRHRLQQSALGHINSDEAVIYLMARHAAEGQFHPFYWGQNYGGTALPDLLGLIFRITGPHIWLLPALEIALALATVLVFRAISARLLGRAGANTAAGLMWLFPLWIYYSGHDPIYLSFGLLAALSALALGLRYLDRPRVLLLVAAGISAGIAFWSSPLTLILLLPLVVTVRRAGRSTLWLVIGAGLGASPWLAAIVLHRSQTLARLGANGTLAGNTFSAVIHVLPAGLWGLEVDKGGIPRWIEAAGPITMVLALVALVLAVRRSNVIAALLAAGVLAWPVALALSHAPTTIFAFRYTTFLLPAICLGLAWGLQRIRAQSAGLVAAGIAAVVALASVSALTPVAHSPRQDARMAAVIVYLQANGRTHVWGSYWLAYEMTMYAQESVTVAAVVPKRYPPYTRAAQTSPRTTIVTFEGRDNDRRLHSTPARRVVIDGFAIYLFDTLVGLDTLPPLTTF
jgi:hypothetical protein